MKIAIAADHGGFELKEALKKHYAALNMADLGTFSADSVDYPDYAHLMAQTILKKQADLGILICGTGIGISIAANRHKGIRAALLYSAETARLAKAHNNANVIVFGGRTMSVDEVIKRIDIFLQTSYEGGRHQRRLDKIEETE
ncbi:MAG: ribose 5-phosphate isomerase B [Alphaproteobacteria bacterium]|nr:ribose 5-phosphate isomerase B [Alphaproteobacteria bacterium]